MIIDLGTVTITTANDQLDKKFILGLYVVKKNIWDYIACVTPKKYKKEATGILYSYHLLRINMINNEKSRTLKETCEEYCSVMREPMENMPLYINENTMRGTIATWRLKNGL